MAEATVDVTVRACACAVTLSRIEEAHASRVQGLLERNNLYLELRREAEEAARGGQALVDILRAALTTSSPLRLLGRVLDQAAENRLMVKDHACAECDGTMVLAGFRCARHEALHLLACAGLRAGGR